MLTIRWPISDESFAIQQCHLMKLDAAYLGLKLAYYNRSRHHLAVTFSIIFVFQIVILDFTYTTVASPANKKSDSTDNAGSN